MLRSRAGDLGLGGWGRFELRFWFGAGRFELRFFLVWFGAGRFELRFFSGLVQGDGIVGFGSVGRLTEYMVGRVLGDEHTRQRGRTGKSQKNR